MKGRVQVFLSVAGIFAGVHAGPLMGQTVLTERFLADDPGSLYYRVGGSGPPLLMVHGFGLSGMEWDRFVEDLAPDFTLIIPDLPGHGNSTRLLPSWDYEVVAGLLFELLDELGLERVDAMGHSAGATTLLQMAVVDPNRIRAMVLVGQTHRLPRAAREQARAYPDADDLPDEERALFSGYHQNGAEQFQRLLPQFRSLADEFQAYDLSPERLGRIPSPTLIVMGDRDPYYPMELVSEFYQALPNPSLWVVPGQGHMPVWPEMGGDALAAEDFPSRVKAFLTNAGTR